MRAKLTTLVLLALASRPDGASAQVAIGEWRDHSPYRQLVDVAFAGNTIYAATNAALFRYDPSSQEIDRFTQVNALSDVGIRTIHWAEEEDVLLVGYGNGNLDILRSGRVDNLADIERSGILGDKGINGISVEDGRAYLCCGFGIVVVDLDRTEVRETWFIGPVGSQLKVNALDFLQDSIHVATENGIYSASRSAPNLASFESWRRRTDVPGHTSEFSVALAFGDRLLVNRVSPTSQDTVFAWQAGVWQPVPEFSGAPVRALEGFQDQSLAICHPSWARWTDADYVELGAVYDLQGTPMDTRKALLGTDGSVVIASGDQGLLRRAPGQPFTAIVPNGPSSANCVRMDAAGGALYVATGGVEGNYSNKFLKDGVQHLVDGVWATTDRTNNTLMATGLNTYGAAVNDILDVAVDPDDPDHAFAASWDDGLLEMRGRDLVAIYNADNSTLQINNALGAENKVEVGGLAFDADGNLWITNSNCAAPIAVRTPTGSWRSFAPGPILNNNSLMRDILPASNGLKWIIRPRSQGMLVFNDNGTLSNTSDDQYKVLNTF